jgi:aspartate aminotransferase-like enzyme
VHKKLFIPGPVEVSADVLAKMATPMIGHRSKNASELQHRISDKLRQVFYTQEEILLSTSSGSGLMEGAVRSCTLKKAAVFSIGAFGNRWHEMAVANQVPADLFEVEWGQATTPDMVDQALATGQYDVLTITHNETSTGLMNPVEAIAAVVKKYPEIVFCMDAVSSLEVPKSKSTNWALTFALLPPRRPWACPPGCRSVPFPPRRLTEPGRFLIAVIIWTCLPCMSTFRKKTISILRLRRFRICLHWIINWTKYWRKVWKTASVATSKWRK